MKDFKGRMTFEFDTGFDDDISTEETVLTLMKEDLHNADIPGYVEGSLKLVKSPTYEEFDKMRNEFLHTASFMDKLRAYNRMFVDIYNSISVDLPLDKIDANEELIIDFVTNEIGFFEDVDYLLDFVESRDTLNALNKVYAKAKLQEEEAENE